jgi:hypothetical protein
VAAVLSQFEEFTPRLPDMNPSARPLTSRSRDRALARLNSITTGSAIAAAVATGGFGALAAATWSGSSNTTTTSLTTTDTSGQSGQSDPTAAALGAAATQGPSATSRLQPTSAPAAVVTKKAKVTSGGSH